MKKQFAAVAYALAFACAPAFVHAATTPSADPAVVKATKEMMSAMKMRDLMLASMRQMEQQMPAQIKASMSAMIANDPNMNAQQKADAQKKVDAMLPKLVAKMQAVMTDPSLIDEMLTEMVPLYAETYTLDEINQLSAFYASPLGQKMLANMPTLMARSMQISQRIMMPRIQKLMATSAQDLGGK
jgi:hypothetical protein